MANYGPADFKITYDSTDITQYVMTINDVSVEQAVEEVHSLGDAWEEYLNVGVGKIGAIELGGLYDDTASTGPDALFKITTPAGPATAGKVLVITWGGSKTTTVTVFKTKYTRKADRNGITKYTATLQPSGQPTEA